MKSFFKKCAAMAFAILMSVSLATNLASALPQTDATQDSTSKTVVDVRPGDRCIVCDEPLDGKGLAILYQGKRIAFLNEEMLAIFLRNPTKYLSGQRDSIFDLESMLATKSSLLILIVILTALASAITISMLARRQNRPVVPWFLFGFVLNFLGVIWFWMKERRPQS